MSNLAATAMSNFSRLVADKYVEVCLLPFHNPQHSVAPRESFLSRIETDARHWRVRYPLYTHSRLCVVPDPQDGTLYVPVLRDWSYTVHAQFKPNFIPTSVFLYERERECNNTCFKLKSMFGNQVGDHYSGTRLHKRFKYIKPEVDTIKVVGGWKLVRYRFPEYSSHGHVFEWHELDKRLSKAWNILKENATQQRKMFRSLTVPTKLWRPISTPLPLNL
jgi:hypothetical protein